MSITYEHAVEAVRDVGARLASEIPASLPGALADRLPDPDDVLDGLEAVVHAVAPVAVAAVDAGGQAAVTTTRFVRRHPLLVVSAAIALPTTIALLVRLRSRRLLRLSESREGSLPFAGESRSAAPPPAGDP